MINKIKTWVMGVLVHKYALGYIVKGYRALTGQKTTLATVAAALVFVAQAFGYISEDLAGQLYTAISAVGAQSFIEKMKRYQKAAEKVAESVKEEAAKK